MKSIKKDFIVYRTIIDIEGKPHVSTYSEEELVHCKDCIHYRFYGLEYDTMSECTINHTENPSEDWFCADAKKGKL